MSTYKRIQEKRWQRRWRLFKKMFIATLIGVVFGGIWNVLHQPFVVFGSVYITGIDKFSRAEITELIGLKEPINLFLIDDKLVQDILGNDLRISKVTTQYVFPNIYQINIVEAQPLFYVNSSYGIVTVREDGKINCAAKNIKAGDALFLSGLSLENQFIGDKVDSNELKLIIDFLNSIDVTTRKQIAELAVVESKVKIYDLSGRVYLLGDLGEIQKKSQSFSAIIKEVLEKNIAIEFVDLSFSKPYIKIKNQE